MDDATKVDVTAEILAMRERFHAQQGGGLAFLAREVEQVMNDRAMLRAEVERLTVALAEARATRATDALNALADQARGLVRAYAGGDKDPEIDVESLGAKLVLWRDLGADGADAPWQAGVIEEGGMGDVPILCGNSAADPEQAVANFRADLLTELSLAHRPQGGA